MWRQFLALFKKELLQLRRDPQSMKLLFALPILQTLLLGYAMTRDVKNISLGVLDLDRSVASVEMAQGLEQNGRFSNKGSFVSIQEARESLLKGYVLLVLVIPRGFGGQIESALPDLESGDKGRAAVITLLVDGQDAGTSATAAGYAGAIIGQWAQKKLIDGLRVQGADARSLQPVELQDRILFNPELTYSWYMVPGMIILLITMTGALLTSFSLVREREKGTLEQLLVTPVRPVQILFGKALPYWILSQVVFFLTLLTVGSWYGIPFSGINWPGIIVGVALYALTSVSLGILVSTVVSSQQQALFLIWFCLIFFVLTSGFMLPFESMPVWMQNLTEFNAVRHFLYMVRALLLRQTSPFMLMPEYAKLLVIGGLLFCVSVLLFRRTAK